MARDGERHREKVGRERGRGSRERGHRQGYLPGRGTERVYVRVRESDREIWSETERDTERIYE